MNWQKEKKVWMTNLVGHVGPTGLVLRAQTPRLDPPKTRVITMWTPTTDTDVHLEFTK